MSTTVLYHMFGIRGYRYLKQKTVAGGLEIYIACDHPTCPCCGSSHVWKKGYQTRTFRSVPIGGKNVTIILDVPRVYCHDCHVTRQVHLTFAKAHKRYTRFFATYVLDLLQYMTCQDVAKHLDVSWDTIREIEREHLQRHFARPPLKDVKYIAIDEIAVRKGHKYLTVVMDLETGRVIFVGDGKEGNALLPFWKRLRKSRANIIAVCTDMSAAYTKAVRIWLPNAIHVFDRFHVMKLFNEKLSNLRRRLYQETKDKDEKEVLKGIRFDLLKRDPSEQESARLEKALKIHGDLAVAYALKEQLYDLWEMDDEEEALALLQEWVMDAKWSEIPEMVAFAQTLTNHWQEILNYYCCELTTGPLEGLNNKIKTLKRQSYGFRDQEYFKLKIMAIHKTKQALVGGVAP